VRLPEGLDTEKVTATFNDGVLDIRIPKVEDKRRIHNIDIK
jgi:HSP20 family molecular chaperone IbpA